MSGASAWAYRAYKIATRGKDVPVIDGLTGDQRFFLAWAQVWRSTQREEKLSHPPAHRQPQAPKNTGSTASCAISMNGTKPST